MEFPLAQIGPQGSQKTPTPTLSTTQPVDLTCKSCQDLGLLLVPRLQTLKAEEAQFSPRSPDVHNGASPQGLGPAPSPVDTGKAEEVPREGRQSLQTKTRAWFQKTQAHGLLQHGAAPTWFHGFITRREAERLLESKPQGCYLVRFSESAVTFVLTYRSRTCCRHFLLAQLLDGRHVVLGEDSAHTRLQDLLRYYTESPLSPYGETLSQPLARETPEPTGLFLRTEESDSGSKSQDPHLHYSPILKKEKSRTTQTEAGGELKEPSQPPRPKPPVPAKPQLPAEVYTSSTPRSRPAWPPKPSNPIYQELDEPIAFYAMEGAVLGKPPATFTQRWKWRCLQGVRAHLASSNARSSGRAGPGLSQETRTQVANNCILKTVWLNKALLSPTSSCLSGDTASLILFLDRCFRTEDRPGFPWGLPSSQ